jgi:hypothetical protein
VVQHFDINILEEIYQFSVDSHVVIQSITKSVETEFKKLENHLISQNPLFQLVGLLLSFFELCGLVSIFGMIGFGYYPYISSLSFCCSYMLFERLDFDFVLCFKKKVFYQRYFAQE